MSEVSALSRTEVIELLKTYEEGSKIEVHARQGENITLDVGILKWMEGEPHLRVGRGQYKKFFTDPLVVYTAISAREQSLAPRTRLAAANTDDADPPTDMVMASPAIGNRRPNTAPATQPPRPQPSPEELLTTSAFQQALAAAVQAAVTQAMPRPTPPQWQPPMPPQWQPPMTTLPFNGERASQQHLAEVFRAMSQAQKNEDRPMQQLCQGLTVVMYVELPHKAFYPHFYINEPGSWMADIMSAKYTFTPTTRNDKTLTPAAVEGVAAAIRMAEKSFLTLLHHAAQNRPTSKADWLPLFHIGALLQELLATRFQGYITGGSKVVKAFELAWSKGTIDFEATWPKFRNEQPK